MPDPHDPIDWIEHLKGPDPPAAAPAWDAPMPSRPRWGMVGLAGTGLAIAAATLLWVAVPSQDGTRLRGAAGGVDIDLRVVTLSDDGAQRLREGEVYVEGQQLAFRVAATPAGPVSLWVEGPAGRQDLGTHERGPTPEDVVTPEGLLTFTLDRPGAWAIHASSSGLGSCPPDACASRTVDVGRASP